MIATPKTPGRPGVGEVAPRVVSIGHILEEMIRFPDRTIGPVVGGPAAYSSVAAVRAGVRCGIVSVISRRATAAFLAPLLESGVNLAGLARRGDTRTSLLSYDGSGAKHIEYTLVADVIGPVDIPDAYLGAEGFLLCPLDFEISLAAVERIAATRGIVMLDLGGWGGVVATRHPVDDPVIAERVAVVMSAADIVKASAEDCSFLVGSTDPYRAARRLVDLGAPMSLVTCGELGLVVDDGTDQAWVRAFEVATADVTGAGDVFCGAFLAEYVRSGNVGEAAEYGAAAAALLVTGSGGVSARRTPSDRQIRGLQATGSRSHAVPGGIHR